MTTPGTILCIASYEKGQDFMRQCKRLGWRVLLVTSQSLRDQADWPLESLDDIFYMPDVDKKWDVMTTLKGISYLTRTVPIDRVVPLDDFDLETAAAVREHLRIPGMGETTTRYFRDKLAMRVKAQSEGIPVPEFVGILNYDRVREFMARVPAPWVLKPRLMAGAIGIKKIHSEAELWAKLDQLGDEQSFYLLERYVPGDVMHVDALTFDSEVRWACASQYGRPPLDVSHTGDVFTSRLVRRGTEAEEEAFALNRRVLRAMRLVRGASHTEFIRGHDGKLYFLETSARVGGAHIADLIEAGTGLNPWREWAKLEIAGEGGMYEPPPVHEEYAALVVSLAKQDWPDTSAYTDPEIVWRMKKKHHVGLIVRSPSYDRITELSEAYLARFRTDFHMVLPPKERPTD